jgi:TolA-binding protein
MSHKTVKAHQEGTSQDPFARFAETVVEHFQQQIKPHIKAVGGVIVVGLAVAILVNLMLTQRRTNAAQAWADVRGSVSKEALIEAEKTHRGSEIGALASLKLARQAYNEGKYDEAAARFATFIKDYPRHSLLDNARLGQAYALEANGETLKAEESFSQLAQQTASSLLSAEAYVGAGRCATSQSKTAEAKKWYEKATQLELASSYKQQAENALKNLK